MVLNSITNTRLEPLVQLIIGAEIAQLKMPEAMQFTYQLFEVIEAAQSDALLCRFIRDHIYQVAESEGPVS